MPWNSACTMKALDSACIMKALHGLIHQCSAMELCMYNEGFAWTHTVPWNSACIMKALDSYSAMELCMYNEGFGLIQCHGTLHV